MYIRMHVGPVMTTLCVRQCRCTYSESDGVTVVVVNLVLDDITRDSVDSYVNNSMLAIPTVGFVALDV